MFLFELLNLSQGFKKYFDITPAVADSLQDEAYGVRHRVYCEELGFEPVRDDHRERDEYDDRAVHVLVKSVKSDRYAGCARIVRVDPGRSAEPLAGREDLRAHDRARHRRPGAPAARAHRRDLQARGHERVPPAEGRGDHADGDLAGGLRRRADAALPVPPGRALPRRDRAREAARSRDAVRPRPSRASRTTSRGSA